MNGIDWTIIVLYLVGMIALSVVLGRGQTSDEDYYVGGRKLPWWAIGISTMATQTSAISFISIPAFVALRDGGGLTWLQYELAVPLAMIAVMVLLIPIFRGLELVSVYEYLELRFGRSVRTLVSAVFLLSRGLATGVGVYATAIVLSVGLGTPLWATILIIGVVTIIYDTLGGMTAVVYSDVIQMGVLLAGIVVSIVIAAGEVGGFGVVFGGLPDARMAAVNPSWGLGGGEGFPFWAFLVGGFFLYVSYYGTDQSQVQRELSAPSIAETKWSLMLNGLCRFPLTILYVVLGMAMYAMLQQSEALRAAVPSDNLDYLVPQFVLLHLPTGVRALLFAALLSAAMSSLDSALNSLSAATMRDFVEPHLGTSSRTIVWSKVTTVSWGLVITGFAFLVGDISPTVIEGINQIGSAFYGPILAAFLVGILSTRATSGGILVGILAGVSFNVVLWLGFPGIYWMWWNLFGCAVAGAVALGVSVLQPAPSSEVVARFTYRERRVLEGERRWAVPYGLLVLYFLGMLALLVALG